MNFYFVEIRTKNAYTFSNKYYIVKSLDPSAAIKQCIISDNIDADYVVSTRVKKINLPDGITIRMFDHSNFGWADYLFSVD